MRLGIVSDTHNNLKNCREIVAVFNDAGVDQVIHTGDITQAKTLDVLSGLAMPLSGVFGNNDQERESLEAAILHHGFNFHEPPWRFSLEGRQVLVVHDPLDFESESEFGDLRLHGHTHRYHCEWKATCLTFNPGECAGMMKGFNNLGIVDLPTLETEIIKF